MTDTNWINNPLQTKFQEVLFELHDLKSHVSNSAKGVLHNQTDKMEELEKELFSNDDPRWNYIRGAFPKTKGEAYECWHDISCGLAEENLWEDGELSLKERNQKERGLYKDANLLFTRFQCPKDIAQDSDADLSKFVEA